MPDRYQSFARTPFGHFVVAHLGLPDPPPLRRYTTGDPVAPGPVVVGGGGRLWRPLTDGVRRLGGEVVSGAEVPDPHALLFDATALTSSPELTDLASFLAPRLRRLRPSGRVLVWGTTPDRAGTGAERIAQRALEGFTRSLAKELRNGATAQLVYVAPGAEDRMQSTLEFLLSARSAFVDGQVVRIDTTVDASGAAGPSDAVDEADRWRPLAGRTALVTGASRGIGAAIARTLRRDGAHVVGVDVASAVDDLRAVMTEVDGDELVLDITAVDAPQRVAQLLTDRGGGVDVVVHNAGITRDRRLVNMDAERFGSVVRVNLTAPERLTGELVEQGLLRPNGRMVGVASVAGIAGTNGQTNYATSKAGVIGLVETAVAPLARIGVTVNAVAPGFIETGMTGRMPFVVRQAGRRLSTLGQGGLPVDVAETIAWLAHPGSFGVTGNVVRVCGQSLLGA
jgi:3-oxoacyl-[acyl-carrier protein] reductase